MLADERKAGDRIEITWEGGLDADAIAAFRPVAARALSAAPRELVLRLDRVTRLDSSGVGAIVFLHRRQAEQGRRLRVLGLSGQPLALARLIRLDVALDLGPAAPQPVHRPGVLARLLGVRLSRQAVAIEA
jgi:anti-anti-sigma factor